MGMEDDNQNYWGSRNIFLIAMLSQTMGVDTILMLPQQAVLFGTMGQVLMFILIYIIMGIPILYMEYVVGQFTGRDSLEVWKIRNFLSHIGYIQIFIQVTTVICDHTINCFVLHYFLISFENPIPYYVCGTWSNTQCDLLEYNYTVHQDCLTMDRKPYCSELYLTFPESQYWRFYVCGLEKDYFYLAWRVSVASGVLCIVLFLSCFKRRKSAKWFLGFYIIFLVFGRVLFLSGSMLQKGIVVKFEDALDTEFSLFVDHVHFSSSVVAVLVSLNVGSGISFNLASKSSFRTPCYSNTVVVAVVSAGITIIGAYSNAMMLCPYSFKYAINPFFVARYPISTTFEMVPRLLNDYDAKSFWLILSYAIIGISFLCVNTLYILSLMEILANKFRKTATYPGMVAAGAIGSLFILTIPLLGNKTFSAILDAQRGMKFLYIFSVVLESLVFLISYGIGKFSEDVHFMLGVKPKAFVKTSWVVSIFVLIYAFCVEFIDLTVDRYDSLGTQIAWWLLICAMVYTVVVAGIKLLIALCRKRSREAIKLVSSWGPKSEVLQRSRAMFTTHAMTKEYIYRQYHLQAGILMRQRRCNIRN